MAIRFNAAYRNTSDGTGTWTRALLTSGQPWDVKDISFDPSRAKRSAFLRKTGFELSFRRFPGRIRVHPYAAAVLDRRAALVVLNVPFDREGAQGWHARLVRASVSMADRVATISEDQRAQLEDAYGRHFAVLTPHPDESFFAPPKPVPAVDGPVRVAYWGGWHERKGMVAALAALEPSTHFEFFVTGSPPDEVARRPDVTSVGRLDGATLVDLIDRCHLAVYPSSAEGFGLPVYEALLRGRPVVVRPLPSYDDFLVPNDRVGVALFDRDAQFPAALAEAAAASGAGVNARQSLMTPTLESARSLLRRQVALWLV